MKCKIFFSRKNKKKFFKISAAEIFTQHAVLLSSNSFGTALDWLQSFVVVFLFLT